MNISKKIFHVASIPFTGQREIVLKPGPQGAEGVGVYFSQGAYRLTAAEGAARNGYGCIFVIDAPSPRGWFRSKNSVCKKHGRPRTWHSNGRDVQLTNLRQIGESDGLPLVAGSIAE